MIFSVFRRSLLMSMLILFSLVSQAEIDVYEFTSEQQSQSFKKLTQELRCPKCQNNNISDSNAPIAQDMRAKVYDMVQQGKSEQQVIDYMIDRYGYFVTYDPPVNHLTLVLWLGPALFLAGGVFTIYGLSRHRRKATATVGISEEEQARLAALLNSDVELSATSDSMSSEVNTDKGEQS